MPPTPELRERWVSYPCDVDDAPASIRVALHLEDAPPPRARTVLHVVGLPMRDPGPLGIGTEAEVESTAARRDSLALDLESAGFQFVGHVRTAGEWQLAFYGPAARADRFLDRAHAASSGTWTHVADDGRWDYFRSFLLPDAERRQWLRDRETVDELKEQGDDPSVERPIEHRLDFPSTEAAELVLAAAGLRGYECASRPVAARADGRFEYVVRRVDRTELEHVHRVVMDLTELAAPYDGDHGGWRAEARR